MLYIYANILEFEIEIYHNYSDKSLITVFGSLFHSPTIDSSILCITSNAYTQARSELYV